jgi:hypothetical protein
MGNNNKDDNDNNNNNKQKKLKKKWAIGFLELFSKYSPSNLKLPKLHTWMSHTSSMIKNFGAINGYTTETYEFLHKFYVKDPYKFSNKKNEMEQILKKVYCF